MSTETAETKTGAPAVAPAEYVVYLERDGWLYERVGAWTLEAARRERRIDAAGEELLALAGGGRQAGALLDEFEDLTSEAQVAATEGLFRAVGEFVIGYEAHGHDLWKALYIRLSAARRGYPGVDGISGQNYVPFDELRFLWGEHWRSEAGRMGVPVPAAT